MIRLVLMVCVALATALPAYAQNETVVAKVSSDRIYLGDSLTLQITVEGSQAAAQPDMSLLDGFNAEYLGGSDQSSRSVTIINGKRSEQNSLRYVMQYRLTPTRAGRLVIPPLTVQVGASAYRTQPVQITALEPTENSEFKLHLDLDKPSAYVGEPVVMRLTWYLGKEARGPSFTGTDGGEVFDLLPGPDPRPPGTAQDDQRYPVLPFLGGQAVGALGQGTLDGTAVTTFTVEQVVIPKQAGEIKVGPFSVAFDAVVGRRQRSFFDSPWGDNAVTDRVVLASPAVSLTVKELPQEGRPATFTGLIGEFSLKASSGASQANVGDPIPLTLTVTGPEPMDRVTPPDLSRQPGFDALFKPAPEGWEAKGAAKGVRTFTTVIRAKSDQVSQVPAINLAYFNTASGTYRVASSDPIPLLVHPTREVTSADAIGVAPFAPATQALALTPGPGGMSANYEGLDAPENQHVSLLAMLTAPRGLLMVLGPVAIFSAVVVFGHLRNAGVGSPSARRRSFRNARRVLSGATTHEQVSDAVRTFLGRQHGAEPSAITSLDCPWLLKGVPQELIARTQLVLSDCERSVYGRTAGGVESVRAQALAVVIDLYRQLERNR